MQSSHFVQSARLVQNAHFVQSNITQIPLSLSNYLKVHPLEPGTTQSSVGPVGTTQSSVDP